MEPFREKIVTETIHIHQKVNIPMNKEIYNTEIKSIQNQIHISENLDSVNSSLQANNWIFLHPYSQGGDIGVIQRMISESENPNQEVIKFFADKFFDLRGTIHFIEGFFNQRPFLKDFTQNIREATILCLQKDFKGAILVIIPVIEGTLRKYLISRKGEHKSNEIDIKELLKALNFLTDEYVLLQKEYLSSKYEMNIKEGTYMDSNQEKQILKKHRYYFDLWMKQFKNFIENNLYLNTKENEVKDKLNRHLIFHGLEDDVEYSFENFLRLFNSISFLSWGIGGVDKECSVLSNIPENEVMSLYCD